MYLSKALNVFITLDALYLQVKYHNACNWVVSGYCSDVPIVV